MKKLITILALLVSSTAYAGEDLMMRADNGRGLVVTITTGQCTDRLLLKEIALFNSILAANGVQAVDTNSAQKGSLQTPDGNTHKACWIGIADVVGIFTEELTPFAVPASAFEKVEDI